MTFSEELLKAAHKHCSHNREAIRKSARAGCLYCCQTYRASEVKNYTNPEDALCPKCGIDSVLADATGLPLSAQFLNAMYDMWFGDAPEVTS